MDIGADQTYSVGSRSILAFHLHSTRILPESIPKHFLGLFWYASGFKGNLKKAKMAVRQPFPNQQSGTDLTLRIRLVGATIKGRFFCYTLEALIMEERSGGWYRLVLHNNDRPR